MTKLVEGLETWSIQTLPGPMEIICLDKAKYSRDDIQRLFSALDMAYEMGRSYQEDWIRSDAYADGYEAGRDKGYDEGYNAGVINGGSNGK